METGTRSSIPVHETQQRYHYHQDKEALLNRMSRIEGQARGVQRMIQDDRYCPEIVQQLSSMIAASRQVSLLLLQHHIQGCVVEAVRQGDGEAKVRELMELINKAIGQR